MLISGKGSLAGLARFDFAAPGGPYMSVPHRDPYKRIDGRWGTIAESRNNFYLFDTGLLMRQYLPMTAVKCLSHPPDKAELIS